MIYKQQLTQVIFLRIQAHVLASNYWFYTSSGMENATSTGTNQQITLLSETDKFGTILFANEAFSKISKFAPGELIHKPHNIIRHPDMPKELFKFLWDTIQKGDVFRGVIKNLAKDGSAYWVNATIMPFKDKDGQISKYVGVRYLIPDEKVAQSLFEEQMKERFTNRL